LQMGHRGRGRERNRGRERRERTVPMWRRGEEERAAADGGSRKGSSQIFEARIWREGAGRRGEAKEGGRNGASEQEA
jgi:hypothetical protein